MTICLNTASYYHISAISSYLIYLENKPWYRSGISDTIFDCNSKNFLCINKLKSTIDIKVRDKLRTFRIKIVNLLKNIAILRKYILKKHFFIKKNQ